MNTDAPAPPEDITDENLDRPDVRFYLGTLAAKALRDVGQVTFVKRLDGGVAWANHVHVFIHPQAVPDPTLMASQYRLVRPVLGDGRPQFVAWQDGVLWEIEFLEPERGSDASNSE